MHVTVLGCGYVGLELARRLTGAGHDVLGVRRSSLATVRETGADAAAADVTDGDALGALPRTDAVVFAASSGGRGAAAARAVYVDGLRATIDVYADRADPPERLLYTSSTSVYGDHGGDRVDEDTPVDPSTEKAEVLAAAERVAREEGADAGFEPTVVRFAGLYGPDRYRVERYLSGPVTEGYLNMLHRDDAAGVLAFALERDAGDLLLAVDDEPVNRWDLADWLADQCGVARPPKRTAEERLAEDDLSPAAERRARTSKRCSNRRLRALGYEFDYPTYREGYRAAIEAYGAEPR
jgi:nucleoside-diphosphate-sugar epimerase